MKFAPASNKEKQLFELDETPSEDLGNDGDYSIVYQRDAACHTIPDGEYWAKRYGRWERLGVVNVGDSQH